MADNNESYEKKVLHDVFDQLNDPVETERKQGTLIKSLLGGGGAGIFIAFLLAFVTRVHPVFITFIAGMSGVALGFGYYLVYTQKQWPYTKQYIDLEKIQKRLDEID